MGADEGAERRAPLSSPALVAVVLAAVLSVAGLVALGTWQLERRVWKLDLIARIEQRVHAPAVTAPAPDDWPRVSAARDEYRHVSVTGAFLHERETLVQASTVLGAGYWVLTPLRSADGAAVLVNRGFVAPEQRERATRLAAEPQGVVSVTGLLRIAEPAGSFLRRNDPAANRWSSRDVRGIASARGLGNVAPYFIDAAATAGPRNAARGEAGPVGGLTVIDFQNNHLVYAITWFSLAVMVASAAARVLWEERRLRKGVWITRQPEMPKPA